MTKYKIIFILFIAILIGFSGISFFYPVPLFLFGILILLFLGSVAIGVFSIQKNFFFKSYNNGPQTKKEIAISFDDGPNAQVTPLLLDILANNNVKATFFCVGEKILENKDLVKRIAREGHIVGNHSYSHSILFDFMPPSGMIQEINSTNELIYKIIGKKPRFFRPPFGITNPFVKKAINHTGMTPIGWSLRSLDTVKNEKKVLARIKNKIQPGDIVLMHDKSKHILSVVQDLISWVEASELKIVSLNKLLALDAYEAD